MERKQFTFYRSYWEAIRELPIENKEEVINAICEYALDGKEMQLSGISKAIFLLVKPTLDASAKKAANGMQNRSKREANQKQTESKTEAKQKQNASKDESNEKQTVNEKENEKEIEKEIEKENEKEIEKEIENECYYNIPADNNKSHLGKTQKRFVKPTVEEIEAYCKERDNGIDAERFWDYYEARGWAIGKNQMKDWKAAVRTWEKNSRKENTSGWHNVTESNEDDAEWHTAEWWGVKSVPLD